MRQPIVTRMEGDYDNGSEDLFCQVSGRMEWKFTSRFCFRVGAGNTGLQRSIYKRAFTVIPVIQISVSNEIF